MAAPRGCDRNRASFSRWGILPSRDGVHRPGDTSYRDPSFILDLHPVKDLEVIRLTFIVHKNLDDIIAEQVQSVSITDICIPITLHCFAQHSKFRFDFALPFQPSFLLEGSECGCVLLDGEPFPLDGYLPARISLADLGRISDEIFTQGAGA
jgi:hypothetical protein